MLISSPLSHLYQRDEVSIGWEPAEDLGSGAHIHDSGRGAVGLGEHSDSVAGDFGCIVAEGMDKLSLDDPLPALAFKPSFIWQGKDSLPCGGGWGE